ncbi:CRTAC1 family protein [Roseimaritima ulvae]|nr:CRTAC1 family protein [Roseimaritima ulvae]
MSLAVLAAILLSMSGCGSQTTPPATAPKDALVTTWFRDATAESQIDFVYRNGNESQQYSIAEVLGGGVGVLDVDLDGFMDFFLVGGGTITANAPLQGLDNGLFLHDAQRRYREVSAAAGVATSEFYAHGVAVGDYNGDGFDDLLVTGYGGLMLYRNQGDGSFTPVTAAAELSDRQWSSSAAWGDLNNDGHLDLYVAHYVDWSWQNNPDCFAGGTERAVCTPLVFDGLDDTLYLSRGDGRFIDASQTAGLSAAGKGLGVTLLDFDGDQQLDIYVANDTDENFLYHNQGGGRFIEQAVLAGTAYGDGGMSDGSMGVSTFDYNSDGLPDLWVSNFENDTFALYRNDGGGAFTHVSGATGLFAIGTTHVGWGTITDDLNNDGQADIVVTNGHVLANPPGGQQQQKPLLLISQQQRFELLAIDPQEYLGQRHNGRGLAKADIDNDGDWDLGFTHLNAPFKLLRNDIRTDRPWVGLQLIGRTSNRNAIGAKVTLTLPDGQTSTRFVIGGSSYLSHSDSRLLWTLPADAQGSSFEILWPSGRRQRLPAPPPGQYVCLVEPR